MSKIAQYYVGIDLHKSILQVCVLDGRGATIAEKRFTGSDFQSGLEVIGYLEQWRAGGRYAVEALGLNRWFVNACLERGLDIVVVNPVQLKLKRSGKKTDRRDAHEIARRLYLGDIDRHALTYYPDESEYGVRKVVRTRHKLVSIRQQLGNQIRSLLNAYRICDVKGRLYSPGNLAKLLALPLPEQLQASLHALVESLRAVQKGVDQLTAQQNKLARHPVPELLVSALPSVGPQTAVTLVSELGDVSRFRNARAVASYAGLVPRVNQSADRSHHGKLTKHGNKELRWIVSQWAVRMLSHSPLVQQWAAPYLRRMHKNKVRMALARRLLIGVYIMLSRGEEFSLERCLAQQ